MCWFRWSGRKSTNTLTSSVLSLSSGITFLNKSFRTANCFSFLYWDFTENETLQNVVNFLANFCDILLLLLIFLLTCICHILDKSAMLIKIKMRELFKHFLPASTLSSTDQTTSSSSRLSNPSRYKVFQIINPLNKGILVTHWNLRKLILLIFEELAWNFGLGGQGDYDYDAW